MTSKVIKVMDKIYKYLPEFSAVFFFLKSVLELTRNGVYEPLD